MARLLFVDDDTLTLKLMAKVANLIGWQVSVCDSGQGGLQEVMNNPPAMVFVDMQMEDMDGIEFVRQVKKLPGASQLPVLICSAEKSKRNEELARLAGASDFLLKPLMIDDLTRIVQVYAGSEV